MSKGHSQEPKAESRKPGRIRSFDAWSLEPGARSRLSEVRSQRSEALVLALAMLACASLSFAQQPQPVQQSPAQQPPVAGVVVLTDDASGLRVQQPVAPQQPPVAGVVIVTDGPSSLVVQQPVAPEAPPERVEQLVPLRGRVVASGTAQGLRGARVTVAIRGRTQEPVFTDSAGAFEVRASPTAVNQLTVTKAGFISTTASRRVPVRRSGPEPAFEIALLRGAVIAGSVRNELGNPAPNVTLRVAPVRSSSRPTSSSAPLPPSTFRSPSPSAGSPIAEPPPQEVTTQTDDLGEFRIAGLTAGRYVVRASGGYKPESTSLELSIDSSFDFGNIQRTVDQQPSLAEVTVDVASGEVVQTFLEVPLVNPALEALVRAFSELGASLTFETNPAPVVRGGVVTGTVLDEFGEPVEGADVELRPIRLDGGRGVMGNAVRGRKTDDRGRFRLFGVPADTYYLALTTASGDGSAPFAPLYYPGRAGLYEAVRVAVEDGKERSDMDLTFAAVRNVRVKGVVVDAAGLPGITGHVALGAHVPWGVVSLPGPEAAVAENGTFEMAAVAPGSYVLHAFGQGSTGAKEFGLEHVNIGGSEVDFVGIATRTGSGLSGRVTFEGTVKARPSSLGVKVFPADPAYSPMLTVYMGGLVSADRTFELTGLIGPGHLALEGAPDGWWLKSVTIAGVDVTDVPVTFGWRDYRDAEVVVATTGGRLDGRVTSCVEPGKETPRVGCSVTGPTSVAVFPANERLWFPRSRHLRLVRVAPDGRFAVSGLPPGDYWAAAVETGLDESADTGWQHTEFLSNLLGAARRVQIGKEGSTVIDLPLAIERKP